MKSVPLVYFVEALKLDLVKIGKTAFLERRFTELQAANAAEIYLVGIIPCITLEEVTKLERELHRRFSSSQAHDEWFNYDDNVKSFVKENTVGVDQLVSQEILDEHGAATVAELLRDYHPPQPLLTVGELAEHWKVSKGTIRREVARGRLSPIRVGGQLRFDTMEAAKRFAVRGGVAQAAHDARHR